MWGSMKRSRRGLARKEDHQWAAWDSYRRFLQTWAMFQGIDRNIFDEIMKSYKSRYAVAKKFSSIRNR